MGAAERNVILGIHRDEPKPEVKKDERIEQYETLKAEFEAEVKEYNESADALLAWHNELEERKADLDKMLEQL